MLRPLLLTLLGLSVMAAEGPLKDRLIQKNGPVIEASEVLSETSENISFKLTPNAQTSTRRSTTILRVEYAGMRGGSFRAGLDAMAKGAYDEAADRFHQAAQGEREWEKVYGAMYEGDALELAMQYPAAAKAFESVVTGFPKHRLNFDATYRLGMNQAWAKDPGATKTADALTALSKGTIGQPAESRANAIRAAAAQTAGNALKFDEFAKKAIFRPADEPEVWFHFSLWLADTYRLSGKPKDAARIIDGMLPALDVDPARKAQALGIKGLALADSDPQSAIIELLKLDVLPFGSEEQRCAARFQAGKLMLAEAKTLAAAADTAADERKTAFVGELRNSARFLLQAAADSLTNSPMKDQAKTLLATLQE